MTPEELRKVHPGTKRLLSFFRYSHLPLKLQEISRPYAQQAVSLFLGGPQKTELTVALRKLLESKDAAVRNCVEVLGDNQLYSFIAENGGL